MFISKSYAAISGFAAVSSAHMLLANPAPFAGTISSPLEADGSNFPCQNKGFSGSSTPFALGASVDLAFTGQAVHGGGSCQVSITYDATPTKSSVWKVIHTIQGGCPAIGQTQNMGADAAAPDPYTYKFQIPTNIPIGNGTLAWTWINRIGNREFYMNCAPVSLTGTGGSKSNFDALPDMQVVNILSISPCTTKSIEGADYLYPYPGNSVENHPISETSFKRLDTCAYPDGSGSTGSGSGSSGSGSSGSGSSGSSASAGSGGAAPKPTSTTPPGAVFVTVSSGGAPSATAAASGSPSAKSAAPTNTAAPGPSVGSGTSGSSSGSGSSSSSTSSQSSAGAQTAGTACKPEGQYNCLGQSFQRCASGLWSVVQPLAAGTKCTSGLGDNINIVATNAKARRHAMRHAIRFSRA